MGEKRGMKALELWCKRVTDGYPGVKVENMTTSWRDGLAFCALIHHFRPDLIDFTNLDKNDIYGNNELAFRTAERHLGIPALLDAEDMAEYEVPDRLSILTYLSQFYQAFASQASSPVKRTTDSPDRSHVLSSAVPTPPSKEVGVRRREPCRACGLPVFLAQRLIVSSHLYHRTCFRCARCSAQLSLANCYETQEGVFCCETCPDEEARNKMAEEEIGDKGGGTISDTKCVNIVNEDNPSLEKDIQLTTALEKIESLVSTRNASLVGLRRMMFENISHTDDEKLPKFRKLSYEKSFQESQKSDRKSDFIIKDLSENNSASIKLSEANLVKSENKTNDDSFLTQSNLDKRRYSDISFIDKESDQEESDTVVEKNALVDEASLEHKESQDTFDNSNKITKEKFNVDLPVDAEVDVPIVLQEKSNNLEVQVEESDKLIDNQNSLTIVEQNIDSDNEFIDVKVDGDEENILIEAKNNSIAISEPFVEAKNNATDILEEFVEAKNDTICQNLIVEATNDTICQNLVVEATNDVVCESFINEKTTLVKLREPTEVSSDLEPTADIPIPPARGKAKDKVISPTKPIEKKQAFSSEYPEDLNPFGEEDNENVTTSTNPFGSSDDEDEKDVSAEAPTPHKRKLLHAPKVSLNPFGSDSDEEFTDEDTSSAAPVPMPRSLRTPEPSPLPRSKLRASKGSLGSATSLGSRKKKHAPLPPPIQSPKTRKVRQAPRPPPVPRTVSPSQPPPLPTSPPPSTPPSSLQYIPSTPPSSEKNNKDYVNRQRQNSETSSIDSYMLNKSTYGQWKRKKGPAPARPIPQRRLVKPMPIKDIRQELDDIEIKQQELERQGVKLEQTIRDKFELDSSLTPYVEEMVLQLFELVNEKNELFRRQAELMYLRRQHNLEEEHAELEYQIRCLMLCPDHNKTDSDKAREEELIHRLVEVVERRDEIIQCLEIDRLREAEEDRSVNTQLGIFSAAMGSELDLRTKSDKKEKKAKKEKKMIKKETLDVDKDFDEMDKERKKHKKKWFTLHHKT